MMPKISVIIPVYNTEKYLKKCLDSIIFQTLEDIEIICIDDCSLDFSKQILEEYSNKDGRIKLIYNEKNMGLSYTRNRGIDSANGQYIRFVDSDDFMDLNSLEDTFFLADKYDLDFLKFRYEREFNHSKITVVEYGADIDSYIFSGIDLLEKFMVGHILDVSACTSLIKRDFLEKHNIRFYEGIYFEDFLFTYQLLLYSNKCMCVNYIGYTYVRHSDSITMVDKTEKHLYGLLVDINEIIKNMLRFEKAKYVSLALILYLRNKILNYIVLINRSVDQSYWDKDIVRLYDLIVSSHYLYIDVNTINAYADNIKNSSQVYIFGAGAAAKELLQIFHEKQIGINGVVVSNLTQSTKAIMGHKVKSIDSLVIHKDKLIILVAVSAEYKQEILILLQRKGFENVIYVGK